MSGSIALLMLAASAASPSEAQRVCAKEVGAQAAAYRLADLPPDIQKDLAAPNMYLRRPVADYDAPLLETDAPTAAEAHYPTVRFAQAMLVRDEWFVQVQTSMMSGVLTVPYQRSRDDGRYHFTPWHVLRGPPCETIRAALAGVSNSVALLALVSANAAPEYRRAGLDQVLSELRLKWRSSPAIIKQLDASQRSWERSTTETCSGLVKESYDHGTIEPVKEAYCLAQAASQRAALLTATFQSTLQN